jgi:glycerol-3-phosphate dehydrogenase
LKSAYSTRLIKGSHLVVDKLFDHNHAFFLTGKDGRIIFVIPFQDEFSLIGTTEVVHQNIEIKPNCSDEETNYLLNFINSYFSFNLKKDQIISTFSGVRPLYNKKKQHNENISSITRDYVLNLEYLDHLPFLTIYGGKLTTFRKLSENVLSKLKDFFPEMGNDWTMKKPLPGGDFLVNEKKEIIIKLQKSYPYLGQNCAKRFINYYGTLSYQILKNVKSKKDLGINFGHSLTEIEVDWLLKNEFANSADDILWRRTKLGLKFNKSQKNKLTKWIETRI